MRKTDVSVSELAAMIDRRELRLPEMQRGYVWKSTQVRDLLDSLYRGYPSGAILVWETGERKPERRMALEPEGYGYEHGSYKLLLDGQQRLTSLSAVLSGKPVGVGNRKRPISILFNLEHPDTIDQHEPFDENSDDEAEEAEELQNDAFKQKVERLAFVVESKRLLSEPHWIRVSEILGNKSEAEILRSVGITDLNHPLADKYMSRIKRVRQIKDYMYVMQVLGRDLSYEEVAEIFVRVNSSGTKLRGTDLALAQITAKWQGASALFEEFLDECKGRFDLDLGILVRTLVAFATGQSTFKSLNNTSAERLKAAWEPTKDGLRFAINFLNANAGIRHSSLLSSQMFLIPIAYLSFKLDDDLSEAEEKALRYWLYVASAKGHFSASSESHLGADLAAIRDGEGVPGLLELLVRQVGRLEIRGDDLKGKRTNNPLFSLMFLTIRSLDAKDWSSGLAISLAHKGVRHRNQYHHIFPKALIKDDYTRAEVNEIANMAFISGRTNRRIGAKRPADYLESTVAKRGEAVLEAQCIPMDRELWELLNYQLFLEARRELLAEAMNGFLDASGGDAGAATLARRTRRDSEAAE